MKVFDKYRREETNDKEREAMTEHFIKRKFDGDLRNKMVRRLQSEYGISRNSAGASRKMRRMQVIRWIGSAAAAILVGLAIWQIASPSISYQALTDEYLAYHEVSNETRKGPEDISELRAAAINAYIEKDFTKSTQLRESITAHPDAREEDYYFLGLSYLYQSPPLITPAIQALQKAISFPGNTLEEESQWYLSLAYLKANSLEQARSLLNTIVANNQWHTAEAQQLLESLPN